MKFVVLALFVTLVLLFGCTQTPPAPNNGQGELPPAPPQDNGTVQTPPAQQGGNVNATPPAPPETLPPAVTQPPVEEKGYVRLADISVKCNDDVAANLYVKSNSGEGTHAMKKGDHIDAGGKTVWLLQVGVGTSLSTKWARVDVGGTTKVLDVGYDMEAAGVTVRFDDFGVPGYGTSYKNDGRAVLWAFNSDGTLADMVTVGAGETKTVVGKSIKLNDYTYDPSAIAVSAKFTVDGSERTLGLGDTMQVGSSKVQLADLTVQTPNNCISNKQYALFDYVKGGNIAERQAYAVGEKALFGTGDGAYITDMAMGVTLNAKQVKMKQGDKEKIFSVGQMIDFTN